MVKNKWLSLKNKQAKFLSWVLKGQCAEWLTGSGREIGKFVRNVKAYFSSLSSELKAELDILDELEKVKKDLMKSFTSI